MMNFKLIGAALLGAASNFFLPLRMTPAPRSGLRRSPSAGRPNCRDDLRPRVRRGAVAFIYPGDRERRA